MKKIPTIFNRDRNNMSLVEDECNNDCLWVFAGEGVATRKYDGTCCLIKDGRLFKRREIKAGKVSPIDFVEEGFDPSTGKRVGWVHADKTNKDDKWHFEAFDGGTFDDGTYELCGPKVQGNPERFPSHTLLKHSEAIEYGNCPRSRLGLIEFLQDKDIEGIVFHHPDGRMGKIKKRDFGLSR